MLHPNTFLEVIQAAPAERTAIIMPETETRITNRLTDPSVRAVVRSIMAEAVATGWV
jgi:hypothetical protein